VRKFKFIVSPLIVNRYPGPVSHTWWKQKCSICVSLFSST